MKEHGFKRGGNVRIAALAVTVAVAGLWLTTPATAQNLTAQAHCNGAYNDGHSPVVPIPCDNNGASRWGNGFVDYVPGSTRTTALERSDMSGSASARADYGLNGVAASAKLDSAGPDMGGMHGNATSRWEDALFIDAPGLTVGDAVRVRMTQWIDVTSAFVGAATASSIAEYYIASVFEAPNFQTGACMESSVNSPAARPWCDHPLYDDASLSLGRTTLVYEFNLGANQTSRVMSYLYAFSQVTTGYLGTAGGGKAGVDALNTAHTFFTVLTPGVTLRAASGHDYALPAVAGVPEPATWGLLILGMGAIGAGMRTARRPAPRRA